MTPIARSTIKKCRWRVKILWNKTLTVLWTLSPKMIVKKEYPIRTMEIRTLTIHKKSNARFCKSKTQTQTHLNLRRWRQSSWRRLRCSGRTSRAAWSTCMMWHRLSINTSTSVKRNTCRPWALQFAKHSKCNQRISSSKQRCFLRSVKNSSA